jgi:hypothetical protein
MIDKQFPIFAITTNSFSSDYFMEESYQPSKYKTELSNHDYLLK